MRIWLPITIAALLVAALPVTAQNEGGSEDEYKINELKDDDVHISTHHEGQKGVWVTLRFRIERRSSAEGKDLSKDQIIVEEDGHRVAERRIRQPKEVEDLTAILAMDMSGSMVSNDKIKQAKRAAHVFLDKLHAKADCGLILFDDKMREPKLKPAGEPREPVRLLEHRNKLRDVITHAKAEGGTAYLQATVEAMRMLRGVRGRRAVLVMTDGVDLNSVQLVKRGREEVEEKLTLEETINLAKIAEVPVYTVGVGEPGQNEKVTTVLVLDRSGSMMGRASDEDDEKKIIALHRAATRFIKSMRPTAQATVLTFSDKPEPPQPFTTNQEVLEKRIKGIKAGGETALFDATYDAIETILAARPEGKRAIVVMTDGVDNRSRRRVTQVIERAKKAKIPLYMLGLGREEELDEEVMKQMADATGGQYYPARNAKQLFAIFENLSIKLHDDGIDEESLEKLAKETGGKYYRARDVSKLHLIFEEFADEIQNSYEITYRSPRKDHDGTARGISIKVERDGKVLGQTQKDYQVHGVVVPEMKANVYLVLLVVLGGLLAAPTGLRRLYRLYGGK